MAKYIEVVNNNNIVSLDDTMPRLYKTRSVSLDKLTPADVMDLNDIWEERHLSWSINPSERPRFIKRYDISLATNEVFFSIRAKNNVPQAGILVSQTDKLFFALNRTVNKDLGLENNFILDFYGKLQNNNAHGVGLQAFDENGNLIFDSSKYYLDVKSGFFYNNDTDNIDWDSADLRNGFSTGANVATSAVILNTGICSDYLWGQNIWSLFYFAIFDGAIKIKPWIVMDATLFEWGHRFPSDSRQCCGLIVGME